MSVKIVQNPLPNGVVPYEDMADPIVKRKVMLLNQNIKALASQLAELQRAAIELQQRPSSPAKQKEIADIERYVAAAGASAAASAASAASANGDAGRASSAAESAVLSASSAELSKNSASDSARNASVSESNANTAKENAESASADAAKARDEAVSARDIAVNAAKASVFSATIAFCNIDLGADSYTKFFLDSIVRDTSKTYVVDVTFNNTYTSSYSNCNVKSGEGLSDAVDLKSRSGDEYKKTASIEVSGTDYFAIDNQSTYVDVVIRVHEKVEVKE